MPDWWSVDGDQLTLSVGEDTESYDVVVVLPSTMSSEIQTQLVAALHDDWH
jgi:hypothetical protein